MRNTREFDRIKKIFEGFGTIDAKKSDERNRSVYVDKEWVGLISLESPKEGYFLSDSAFRGGAKASDLLLAKYRQAIEQLKEAGYRIEREAIMGPHLLLADTSAGGC